MTPFKNSPEQPSCFTATIEHENFNFCLDRLRELIRMQTSTRIVLVTGPTGAGKTTMRERLEEELKAMSAEEIAKNPEMVPYGACAVKAPGPTAFSWKDTYLQMLRSLQHPFADNLSLTQPKHPSEGPALKGMSPEAAQRLSNDRLFRILQRTIEHRKPKALIFDEAHHLLRVTSSQSLVNQLEHLKYIADETRTVFILFGTYELIKLMDLSSALIRRREVVHFPRYIYDAKHPKNSLEDFAKAVAVFARDLDQMSDIALLTQVPYLYQGSVGCVGILRDWLFRAFCRAKETGSKKITTRILDQTILAVSDRRQLFKEAKDGESYFLKRSLCEVEYLSCLGFSPVNNSPADPTPAKSPKKAKRKPGERNPHNDPVGTDHLDPANLKAAA